MMGMRGREQEGMPCACCDEGEIVRNECPNTSSQLLYCQHERSE